MTISNEQARERRRQRREQHIANHMAVLKTMPTLWQAAKYCRWHNLPIDLDFFREQPASEPVEALPGSPEKLAAIRERLERGESLWHEEDGLADEE